MNRFKRPLPQQPLPQQPYLRITAIKYNELEASDEAAQVLGEARNKRADVGLVAGVNNGGDGNP